MTTALAGEALAQLLREQISDSVEEWDHLAVWVNAQRITEVGRYLKEEPSLAFNYLNSITAVDYVDYFEMVYHLTSLHHNHSTVLKARLYGREDISIPSVISVWQGADFQEREVWDLMGVRFEGHPNLKRIMLWEGFAGHPLRRDFMQDSGGHAPTH